VDKSQWVTPKLRCTCTRWLWFGPLEGATPSREYSCLFDGISRMQSCISNLYSNVNATYVNEMFCFSREHEWVSWLGIKSTVSTDRPAMNPSHRSFDGLGRFCFR
jgi:hypothetical protein